MNMVVWKHAGLVLAGLCMLASSPDRVVGQEGEENPLSMPAIHALRSTQIWVRYGLWSVL